MVSLMIMSWLWSEPIYSTGGTTSVIVWLIMCNICPNTHGVTSAAESVAVSNCFKVHVGFEVPFDLFGLVLKLLWKRKHVMSSLTTCSMWNDLSEVKGLQLHDQDVLIPASKPSISAFHFPQHFTFIVFLVLSFPQKLCVLQLYVPLLDHVRCSDWRCFHPPVPHSFPFISFQHSRLYH